MYGNYGLPPSQASFAVHCMVALHYQDGTGTLHLNVLFLLPLLIAVPRPRILTSPTNLAAPTSHHLSTAPLLSLPLLLLLLLLPILLLILHMYAHERKSGCSYPVSGIAPTDPYSLYLHY